MTQASYSFLSGAPLAGDKGRTLPTEDTTWDARVAADATFPLTAEEQEADALAALILDDLASASEREREKHVTAHFPSLYRMMREYAAEYPALTFREATLPAELETVAVSAYALLFCFGAVAHAADSAAHPVTVSYRAEDESVCLSLTVGRSETTGVAFALSPHRVDVLKKIAALSGFSMELTKDGGATVAFLLPCRRPEVITTAATSSPWLRRAFFLPRYYFY
ncbi:MAG: hypothetical protein IJF73_01440 [Clostridia bacterium]|nr:hypothetical protein [Clostridia bacterium]